MVINEILLDSIIVHLLSLISIYVILYIYIYGGYILIVPADISDKIYFWKRLS